MAISRRTVLLSAGAGLAFASGAAHAQGTDESGTMKQLYAAAKKEGQVTWYSGILDQPLCEKIAHAFTATYPGISVSVTKTTSDVAFQRVLQDMRGGAPEADVFTTTDASQMTYLIGKKLLVKYTAENAQGLVKSLQAFNGGGYYQVSWVGQVVLLYNHRSVHAADAPKDWPDLTDAKWKNQITFGSPNYSGLVGVWTVGMTQKYGWSYFDKLAKLNPLIGRSVDDAVTVLNSGERSVAAGNPSSTLRSAAKGNPLSLNYPTSGTLIDPSPTAILKGSHSPNAAKLFMEFLAGPKYSQILADGFEQPLRPDVKPPAGAKSLAEIKTFAPSLADIEKLLPGDKQKWRSTFG